MLFSVGVYKKVYISAQGGEDESQRKEARRALEPIRKKLAGLQSTVFSASSAGVATVENQVERA